MHLIKGETYEDACFVKQPSVKHSPVISHRRGASLLNMDEIFFLGESATSSANTTAPERLSFMPIISNTPSYDYFIDIEEKEDWLPPEKVVAPMATKTLSITASNVSTRPTFVANTAHSPYTPYHDMSKVFEPPMKESFMPNEHFSHGVVRMSSKVNCSV